MIPFELYSITPSVPYYGHIFCIPNYYTPLELDTIVAYRDSEHAWGNGITGTIPHDSYPNYTSPKWPLYELNLDGKQTHIGSEKTTWLYENWDDVRRITESGGMTKHDYYKDNQPIGWSEQLRGNPPLSRPYPNHDDYGSRKLLTILVPLCDMGDPTRFNGINGESPTWSLPWEMNRAYMFRPSRRSIHSYVNTMDMNRWVVNVNVVGDTGNATKANPSNR